MQAFHSINDVLNDLLTSDGPYLEFLRVPSMSCGIYVLEAGAEDRQRPHQEDELYYVISGEAGMKIVHDHLQVEDRSIAPGDTIFVKAGQEHRFHSIAGTLAVLVVFAPVEGSRKATA